MQGGRSEESIRFPPRALIPTDNKNNNAAAESSGNESEMSIDDVVSLGVHLDLFIHSLRMLFGTTLALPVAWLQFKPTMAALRDHKLKQVETGTHTILALQQRRSPILDVIMQTASFCAEEEFYLIVLPILFWTIDYFLARRVTLIVVSGLFVGNVIKDMFQLPRPTGVWRPSHNLDSTQLADFGFPSTHAMNSVTNSLYTVYHYRQQLLVQQQPPSSTNIILPAAALLLAFSYVTILSISRLYLGAHTPTDVRGGLGLGIIVLVVFCSGVDYFDSFISRQNPWHIFWLFFPISITLLLLCPQPRPPTPTFLQNSLLVGLGWGLLAGSRFADEYGLSSNETSASKSSYGIPFIIVTTILGFIIVMTVRIVVKQLATLFVTGIGIRIKPEMKILNMRNRENPRRRIRRVRLFTRDVDLIGVAFIKTITYMSVAFGITFIVPYVRVEMIEKKLLQG
jgi:membrane-associated phospholipid phosphatase